MKRAIDPVLETNDQRWEAVVRRDPQSDGAFFYGVKTTGVYCRPACCARPAEPTQRRILSRDGPTPNVRAIGRVGVATRKDYRTLLRFPKR
ncbi:MAG: Ada metal-binding domain-containing protein [Candidatus Competibacter sp.]